MTQWIILVPRGAEYQAVLRGLARRDKRMGNLSVKTTATAIAIPAGTAAKTWLAVEFSFENPAHVLSLGLCGGLSDRTPVGTVVIYNAPELAQKLGFKSVRGRTIDRVLCLAKEKRDLAQTADVVDMESQHIVTYCRRAGLGVRVIRVVSDDTSGDLPDISAAIDGTGHLRPWALMVAFGKDPIAAVRLIRGSLRALKRLELAVSQLDFDRLTV
jgi:nucleoside phosphorylase